MLNFLKKKQMGTGAVPAPYDSRDRIYDEVAMGSASMTKKEWELGFNVEDKLNIEFPIKHQNSSSSCVGNGWSYYIAVLNLIETKKYTEVSAKAIYSQICFPGGGAYINRGGALAVNWGSVNEDLVSSYENGKPPSEKFMVDLSWKNESVDRMAKVLQAKEYRRINAKDNMELFAQAIRDNNGVVGGLYCGNNGSWRTENPTPSTREGGHCIWYSAFGIDNKGKYIATLNSWGKRPFGRLQKLRQDYFNKLYQFDPFTLVDKPNVMQMSTEASDILAKNEKHIIIEGEGVGKKGIVVNGKLMNILENREADACLYGLANNGYGATISSKLYNEIYCIDNNF